VSGAAADRIHSGADARSTCADYLRTIGVRDLPPATSPFDPGYDPLTLRSHLEQSAHLMATLKISMACWMIADEASVREKAACARAAGVPTVAGGGPFEIACARNALPQYLDLCADIGFARVESAEGFTTLSESPARIVAMASERGLEVEFELGQKHAGAFEEGEVARLIRDGHAWLDAGARRLVVEARESARDIGVFDRNGRFDSRLAERFVEAFGFDGVVFEAPLKESQFAMLEHFGPEVQLSNVRLEELLRVEIFRRGLHSDAYCIETLQPPPPGGGS
jgi:phosphosulfolactate synthase